MSSTDFEPVIVLAGMDFRLGGVQLSAVSAITSSRPLINRDGTVANPRIAREDGHG
jgi:hypothetical protein